MKPLNFAILDYMTTVPEACAEEVVAALRPAYGSFRALNVKAVRTALLTATVNGLLEESRCELDEAQNLRLYLTGQNLLCFSDFDLWDPEMGDNGLGYPLQRVYSIGVNINF